MVRNFERDVFQKPGDDAFLFQRVDVPGALPTRPIVHIKMAGRE